MARTIKQKTVKEIQAMPDGVHTVGGVIDGNFSVEKLDGKIKRYKYRYRKGGGKPRIVSISGKLSLTEARNKADAARLLFEAGTSPKEQRQKQREEQQRKDREKERKRQTLDYMAEQFFRKGITGAARTQKTKIAAYRNHIAPCIGKKLISEIGRKDIEKALTPIWAETPVIAKVAAQVTRAIFNWAIAKEVPGLDTNPVDINGALGVLLKPLTEQRAAGGHNPALPYERIQEFIKALIDRPCASSQALLFCILTGCRGQEARLAEWKEFDLENGTWTIPEAHDKKKGERNRTRYLSKAVIDILKQLKRVSPLVFVSRMEFETNSPLTQDALSKNIKVMHQSKLEDGLEGWIDPNELGKNGKPRRITPHGFRSTFRTWAETLTDDPAEHALIQIIAERILLHEKQDELHGAYRRNPYEKESRELANRWADYCLAGIDISPLFK